MLPVSRQPQEIITGGTAHFVVCGPALRLPLTGRVHSEGARGSRPGRAAQLLTDRLATLAASRNVREPPPPRTVLVMSDETIPAVDDPERPASKEELLGMLEELRELWWQVEKDRRRVRAGEITRLEGLVSQVDDTERAEIEAALAELRTEQAIEPKLPF